MNLLPGLEPGNESLTEGIFPFLDRTEVSRLLHQKLREYANRDDVNVLAFAVYHSPWSLQVYP
jgi:hypothetical protein